MIIRKIRGASAQDVARNVQSKLSSLGYNASVSPKTATSVNIQNIRLSDSYIKQHGYNYHTGMYLAGDSKKPKRTHILAWKNWVEVNNSVNSVLDNMKVSANASSLGGKFKIRDGNISYGEEDWESLGYENVGSMMNPISRKEIVLTAQETIKLGYISEKDVQRARKKLKQVI